MFAAAFLSPSLPVVLTLITVPAVLWVIAFASKVATKRLAKKALDNKLGLSPEVYACLAYSVMPILLFLFAVFVLKL